MRARITKWMAGLTVTAALAVGGASFASAAGKSSPAPQPPVATVDSGSQQGDQSAPDTATGSESAGEAAGEVSGEASGEATSATSVRR